MSPTLQLRPATEADSRMLWEWANDPIVRAASFSSDAIAWEEHEKWFASKLNDDRCYIFIAEEEDTPIGQIRFDCETEARAIIDIHLAPEQRGKGLGAALIIEGIKKLFDTTMIKEVHAYIKLNNEASKHAFQKAGFIDSGREIMKEKEVYHFTYTHHG